MPANKKDKAQPEKTGKAQAFTDKPLGETLAHIQALIKNTPMIAIQSFDHEGIIRHWNPACEHIYGFSADEVIGRDFRNIPLSAQLAGKFKTLEEVWNTGWTGALKQWSVRTPTGRQRLMQSAILPVFKKGAVHHVFSIDMDITDQDCVNGPFRKETADLQILSADEAAGFIQHLQMRLIDLEIQNEQLRRAQRQLADYNTKYFDLYQFAPLGYFLFDANALILDVNLAGADMLALPKDRLIGESFLLFVAGESQTEFYAFHNQIFENPQHRTCEVNLVKNDATEFYAQLAGVPIQDNLGNFTQLRVAITDITHHKHATEMLHTSEEKYKTLLETISYGIQEVDNAGEIIFANTAVHKIFGYAKGELVGKKIFELVEPGQERAELQKYLTALGRDRLLPIPYETKGLMKNGKVFDVQVDWNYKCDKLRKVTGFILIITDVTKHKKAERTLKESEEKFRLTFDQSPVGAAIVSLDYRFLRVNKQLCRITGYSEKELTSISFPDITHPDDLDKGLAQAKLLAAGKIDRYQMDKRYIRKDGRVVWVRISVRMIKDHVRRPLYYLPLIEDITSHKRAEDEILRLNQELEQRVAERTAKLVRDHRLLLREAEERKCLEKEILHISEREKRLIGQELHDSVGQQLAGVAFMVKALQHNLADKLPDEAGNAAEIVKLINQAMDQTRGLAKGLHPVDLDAGSLVSALQELAATTERLFSIRCTCKHRSYSPVRNTAVAVHLYRIAQEAITNAIKHAKADNIGIELTSTGNKLVLAIKNDGIDFPEATPVNTGMGLRIMSHRVEIIGGSFDIRRGKNGGTVLTCIFAR